MTYPRSLSLLLGTLVFAVMSLPAFSAAQKPESQSHEGVVAVIGTGMMGGALGTRLAELGYTIVYGSRSPDSERVQELVARTGKEASAKSQIEATANADMIVLAVPWEPTEAIVKSLPNVDGKIIIDAVNSMVRHDDGRLEISQSKPSAGEMIQSWAPDAKVVKAFNAVGFHIMADPSKAGGPVTVPIASDHPDAKTKIISIIEDLGFEAFDAGALSQAYALESLAMLYRIPYFENRREDAIEFYFRHMPDAKK